MPTEEVFAVAVVLIDPGRDPGPRLGLGGEAFEGAQLELQGAVPAFDDRVVQGRADPAHRLLDAESTAGGAEGLGGVFAALVAVEPESVSDGLCTGGA